MNLFILLAAVLINSLLAIFVLFNNSKSVTNRIFSLLSLVTTAWLVVSYVSLLPQFLETSLLFIRLSIFFAVPIGLFLFLLADNLPYSKLQMSRKNLLLLILVSLTVMVVNISPLSFVGLEVINNQPSPIPGPGLAPFALLTIFFFAGTIFMLIKKLSSSTGKVKEQVRFVMFGIGLMLGLIITTIMLPVVLLRNSSFVSFSPLYTLIFLGMTTYAIVRHRLLDIRLVVARAVAYGLVASVLFVFYVFSTVVVTSLFLETTTNTNQLILYGVLTLIAGYSFQPLKLLFERVTDRIFYKGGYKSQELLSALSNILATTLGIRSLTQGTLRRLIAEMRITRGSIVVFKGKDIEHLESIGYDKEPKFVVNDLLDLHDGKIIVLDELEESHTKDLMRKLDISIAVPLEVGQQKLGYLLLGEKASGEIYTNQDIDVLEVFTPELSIAIENAKSYEEIKQFNIKLEEEVKKATAELITANDRLKELDKAKDEFISVVSHELRTPMTAIKSYVWLVLNGRAGPLNARMQNYLFKVYDSSERLISMINDVLDVSHIETGRLNVEIQPVSPIKVAEDVIDTLKARADEQKIDLIVEKDKAVPMVAADIQKLNEVYTNLIGNALKFTKPEGKVTVSFQKNGGNIDISVADSGIGISKEDLPKLFSKFGRLQKSYATMATSGGSGLGLYITKNYIELMKGKIWVNSTLGKGTTFTFSLPISASQTPVREDITTFQPIGIVKNPKKK